MASFIVRKIDSDATDWSVQIMAPGSDDAMVNWS